MKTCETCGKELVRHPRHSDEQWERKRFCERQCAAQRLVIDRRCACGCGERVRNRKWLPGHRPLKLRNGYRVVWAPGHPCAHAKGSALEHRVIAYDAGLLTDLSLDVHHRNGVKTDNRIENLEVLTTAEHARRHAAEALVTECVHGHAYTPENTYLDRHGWKVCRACNRERQRARHKEAA